MSGVVSLWSGLSASVLRQSTYSTARFGLYTILSRQLQLKLGTSKLSTTATVVCAGVAGGLAGMVGNPTEVILVRMCADAAKPSAERFRYSDAVTALYRITREEGPRVFGRGLSANIVRSVLMSKEPALLPCVEEVYSPATKMSRRLRRKLMSDPGHGFRTWS